MTNIRRYPSPNSPVFITAVNYRRLPVLELASEKERLLAIMREVKTEMPFQMLAYVILNEHFHWLILPHVSSDFSRIMQSVKLRFTHRYKEAHKVENRLALWQRRFWDHVIRDHEDLKLHLDYIHYNPVKHGYVREPSNYSWSSFQAYVDKGYYPLGWNADREPDAIDGINLE